MTEQIKKEIKENLKPTEICIFRHGETEGKAGVVPLVCGHFETALTEKGREQAFIAGTEHKDVKFDICYVSPLDRSEKSAFKFLEGAEQMHIEMRTDPDLIEVNYGGHDGMSEETVKADKKKYFANNPSSTAHAFTSDNTTLDGDAKSEFVERENKYGKAESFDDAGKRYFEAMKRIAKENPGKRVLILGHSGAMRAFEQYVGIKDVVVGESKGFLEPIKVTTEDGEKFTKI